MNIAAIPFLFSGFVLGAALLVSGIRLGEWATALAGIIVIACLTAALVA